MDLRQVAQAIESVDVGLWQSRNWRRELPIELEDRVDAAAAN